MGSSYMKNTVINYSLLILLFILSLTILTQLLFPTLNYRPMPTGLCEGTLSPSKPNWVSSLVQSSNSHHIAPLQGNTLALIASHLKKAQIVDLNTSRLIAYRQSPLLSFTDWICIKSNGDVISSATLGYYDFGKNRQWVEAIRANS